MKKLLLCTLSFLLPMPALALPSFKILPELVTNSQSPKPTVAILPFSAPRPEYSHSIVNALTKVLVTSQRVNVADRANLSKVLKEIAFQQSMFVDPDTAVRIGKLAGVSYILTGQFDSPSTGYSKAQYNNKGQKVRDAYHTSSVGFGIQLIQVSTGQVVVAEQVTGFGSDPGSVNNAISEAYRSVASAISSRLLNSFRIQGKVTKVNLSSVELDMGSNLGVHEQMDFIIADPKDTKNQLGVIRISKISKDTALGRIITSDSRIKPGALALETKARHSVEAKIIKRDFTEVITTMGRDVGAQKGMTYMVYTKAEDYVDSETGERFSGGEKEHGIVVTTDIAENSSKARIVRGIYSIEEGMFLREKGGLFNGINVKPSLIYNPANGVSIARLGVGKLDFINSLTYDVGVNFVTTGLEKVSVFGVDISASYDIPIVPEFFFLSPALGFGFGLGSQDSTATSRTVYNGALQMYPKITARLELNRFNLFAEGGYMLMDFSSSGWGYSVGEGESARSIQVPASSLNQASVSLSGIYLGLGASYLF